MNFLDTNVFLRLLTLSPDSPPIDQLRGERARELFLQIERGETEATTSEVVVHEVFYVLLSKAQYARTVDEVFVGMRYLLNLRGMRLSSGDRTCFNIALDLLGKHPTLGFADAMIAARSLNEGHTLVTFDAHFERVDQLETSNLESLD